MLNEKVAELLNDQINKELYSAYLYLDMADYFEQEGLSGFANWYFIQAREEEDHAWLFRKYLHNNGCKVNLFAIAKPDKEFKSFKDPMQMSLEHERYVTGLINNIYDKAYEVKDYRTMEFLNWFIKEQVEEEKNADDMIKKYELFGSDGKGLYMLDSELAGRVYTAPSLILD